MSKRSREHKKVYYDKEKYIAAFEKPEKALELSLDIRKFEIELYWKRATYFWTFIGVAFAGYFALTSGTNVSADVIFFVSCIGFVFTFSWYLVNRGSKFWQNNWERHVDLLEDEVVGPLYKTAVNMRHAKLMNLASEYPFSVSKINQLLSLFLSGIWLIFCIKSVSSYFEITEPFKGFNMVLVGGYTFIYIICMLIFGKSSKNLDRRKYDRLVFVERKNFYEK
ncbi:hypothetical protein AF331_17980 [Rossellomorea marisflavi]|uniref:Uncharacterized protein n=1 Tax=Rossellomorea marisflavi TaxID=189381 RepID=A0A0M0G195_9BACI|nr:hypothetical protein [Rossellomorea marisflavi]KON83382.1 hypothetical protein AF331_17980 [Rossellomorea marisflavi]